MKTNQQHIVKDVSIHNDYLNLVPVHRIEIDRYLEIGDHIKVDQFPENGGEVDQVREVGEDLEMMIDIDLDLGQVVEAGIGIGTGIEIGTEKERNYIVVDLDLFLGIGKGPIIEADHAREAVTDIGTDDIGSIQDV